MNTRFHIGFEFDNGLSDRNARKVFGPIASSLCKPHETLYFMRCARPCDQVFHKLFNTTVENF
jgi:hypothetical protein